MKRLVSVLAATLVAGVAQAGPVNSPCSSEAKAGCDTSAKQGDCAGKQTTAITAVVLTAAATSSCDDQADCDDANCTKADCDKAARNTGAAKQAACDQAKDCDTEACDQAVAITAVALAGPPDAECDAAAKADCAKDQGSCDMADCDQDAKAKDCCSDSTAITGIAGAGPVNSTCPFSGEDLGENPKLVSFAGKTIGLCCAKCVGKFEAMDDSAKAGVLARVAAPRKAPPVATVNSTCPFSGNPVGASTVGYHGKEYGFCCDDCAEKFEAMDYADKAYVLAVMALPADVTPINTIDPISHMKLAADGPTATIDGQVIGFSSAGDARMFGDWPAKRQSAYVKKVLAGAEWGDSYPLDSCPISGGKLGSMGDPIVRYYEGREVRFCCDGCIGDFEADTAAGFRAVDAKIVASQMEYYPMTTCVVGGDKLGDDAIDLVYRNRLVRFCCKGCVGDFKADPLAYLAKLDQAAIAQQRASYPFDYCLAMPDDTLDEGAAAHEIVVAGRLVRLCCEGCERKVHANPANFLAMIDEARKADSTMGSGTRGTVGRTMDGGR